jgi:2'-5' RNA ligase
MEWLMSESLHEKTVRVFFALWPNEAERGKLAAWQPDLHEICGGLAMRTDTLHATLVFLGEVESHRLEAIQLVAQEIEGLAFDLVLTEARYWGHNHIVYAAPHTVPTQLTQLVHDLEQRLLKHRFHFEPREYKPHVTLLRHAQWSDAPLPERRQVVWRAKSFALVQSTPAEKGANYRVLARFSLN